MRFSSANSRIEIIGIRNSPITDTFISSGRTIISFTFIGNDRPIACDCRLMLTKYPTAFQKKNPKITANIVNSK